MKPAIVLLPVLLLALHAGVCQSALSLDIAGDIDIAAIIAALNAASNGSFSVGDLDECDAATSPCPEYSTCLNSVGSYNCTCLSGFTSGGTGDNGDTSCNDDDECTDSTICKGLAGSMCVNYPGSFNCSCSEGYAINTNETACVDIDECDLTPNPCDSVTNSNCSNQIGSYDCLCYTGYEFNADGSACVDIDECNNATTCSDDPNSSCANSEGSYSCICNTGYTSGTSGCLDIDECNDGSLPCAGVSNSTCSNTEGSYRCDCANGYQVNTKNTACEDINECDATFGIAHDCGTNEVCVNTLGSHECECADGYTGSSGSCVDINECSSDPCDTNALCINAAPQFQCFCNNGYYGSGLSGDCSDVLSCTTFENLKGHIFTIQDNNGGDVSAAQQNLDYYNSASGKATGVPGDSFRAKYGSGLDSHIANVIDELRCDIFSTCTGNDTAGSYECSCNFGYEFVTNSTTQCQDIDECSLNSCGNMAACANEQGTFTCTCPTGYEIVGDDQTADCTDVDECKNSELNDCHMNATCNNIDGSFTCTCNDGFMGSGAGCESALTCEAFNKVRGAIDTVRMASGGEDISAAETILSYYVNATGLAASVPGVSYEAVYGKADGYVELAINSMRCDYFSTCSRVEVGGNVTYTCNCISGYVALATNVNQCQDEDECTIYPEASCGTTGTCVNKLGSYMCNCSDGYEGGDGAPCTDINECAADSFNECGVTGECQNNNGSYLCLCNPGYADAGMGAACTNVNECSDGTHNCSANAACHDTPGSFYCTCKAGYTGSGFTCTDIDECFTGDNNCDAANGNCFNTDGNFTCACKDGFMGSGYDADCEDVTTCGTFGNVKEAIDNVRADPTSAADLKVLRYYHDATNKAPGVSGDSYNLRYDPDNTGLITEIENVINELRCDYFSTCSSSSDASNMTVYTCTCLNGYEPHSTVENQCVDVNECEKTGDSYPCHAAWGVCTNIQGSHECECMDGFQGDGVICTDFDECKNGSHTCDSVEKADCTNTNGSFDCSCKSGYMGNGQADSCTDVSTCETFMNLKNAIDVLMNINSTEAERNASRQLLNDYRDAEGRPNGITQNAFRARHTGMVDSDVELTLNLLRCDFYSDCSHNETSNEYSCTCIEGYTEDFENSGCKDENECDRAATCHSAATCTNTEGSYYCTCNEGYYGNGKTCSDHDECTGEGGGHDCDGNATCENIEGGHTCTCNETYFGDGYVGNCEVITTCDAFNKVKEAIDAVRNSSGTWSSEEVAAARKTLREYNASKSAVMGVSGDSYRQRYGDNLDDDINNVINSLICDYHSSCAANADGTNTCTCNSNYIPGTEANTCLYVQTCDAFTLVKDAIITVRDNATATASARETLTAFTAATGHADAVTQTAYTLRYTGDLDMDIEDALNLLPCDFFSDCTDPLSCTCVAGYVPGENNTCTDFDECLRGEDNNCHQNAHCINNQGSFDCECDAGYQGNGTFCEDVVDCATEDSTLCGANAVCTDVPGSHTCTCNAGFAGNGLVCTEEVVPLFEEDSDSAVDNCDNFDHPMSCHFKQNFMNLAEATFDHYQSFFHPPDELMTASTGYRENTSFDATPTTSSGTPLCRKTTTYASPSKVYTDAAATMEVELFSYGSNRQWFAKTECSGTVSNINLVCNTVSTPQLGVVISQDTTTGKYKISPLSVYIPSSCQLQFPSSP